MDTSQFCLDTSVLIAFLKGREPGASAVEKVVRQSECYITSTTVYELLFGVARAKKEIGENALLDAMSILPFDKTAAKRAAELHAELISQNQDIGIRDVFIAACCLEHELPILTTNKRHFDRVSGLEVITPEEIVAIE